MRRTLLIIALLSAAAPAVAGGGDVEADKTIPARFQGEWNSDPAHCGDRESGTNMVISETGIAYFEAGDTVVSVTPEGANGIRVVVDYEEHEWMERLDRTLVLSPDLQRLNIRFDGDTEQVFQRCPDQSPE